MTIEPNIESMEKVFEKPSLMLSTAHSLCPGCGEPVTLRLILELIEEMGLRDRTVCVCGIGCYTAFPSLIDIDVQQALHGRAPSLATGVKRVMPDAFVWTLQGDGDMISEGLQEVIHSAARGEKFTAIVLNNAVFGETGGHATSATVLGHVARGAVHTPAAIKWTKQILQDAFQTQLERKGFSFVEVLTMCPTDWFIAPEAGPEWLEKNLKSVYPLKVIKS